MLRFLSGIMLILGPSNLASSFLCVFLEEVKEKEKYEKNGQQSFDILLACLCIREPFKNYLADFFPLRGGVPPHSAKLFWAQ